MSLMAMPCAPSSTGVSGLWQKASGFHHSLCSEKTSQAPHSAPSKPAWGLPGVPQLRQHGSALLHRQQRRVEVSTKRERLLRRAWSGCDGVTQCAVEQHVERAITLLLKYERTTRRAASQANVTRPPRADQSRLRGGAAPGIIHRIDGAALHGAETARGRSDACARWGRPPTR